MFCLSTKAFLLLLISGPKIYYYYYFACGYFLRTQSELVVIILVPVVVFIVVEPSSFPTPMEEPKKVVRCHFLGVTQVPKATGEITVSSS